MKKIRNFLLLNQGVTLQIPPPLPQIFGKNKGGVSVKNFFIEDFLSKKIFRRFAPKKGGGGGGVPVVLPPDSLKKISKIFYSQFHWKNNSTFFRKIRRKQFLPQKKKGVTGGENPNNFSRKIRHDLSLGFDIILSDFFYYYYPFWI